MLKIFAFFLLLQSPSFAAEDLSSKLVEKLLTTTNPSAFAPLDLSADDFQLDWKDGPPANVKARLVPDSIQWVRVDDVLVAPRAQLAIMVGMATAGTITTRGFTQPFVPTATGLTALHLVPLMVEDDAPIHFEVKRDGQLSSYDLRIRYKPRSMAGKEKVIFDHSCSKDSVSLKEDKLPSDAWFYIGCVPVTTHAGVGFRRDIQLSIISNMKGSLLLNGMPVRAAENGRWNVRLISYNRTAEVALPTGSFTLKTDIPEIYHHGHLGLGLGAYGFRYKRGHTDDYRVAPFGTIFGSYSLPSENRFVLFGTFSANAHFYADAGGYFHFETIRALDRRLSIRLLLGLHGFSYNSSKERFSRINYPQGLELAVLDAFQPGCTLAAGGIIQPAINGREYYNTWLRWGSAKVFLEMNYFYSNEAENFNIRTYGVTLGFPIVHFL